MQHTTGELRRRLMEMLEGILANTADLKAVAEANKTAGRINESMFAEATMMQRQRELGHKIEELGGMKLNSAE